MRNFDGPSIPEERVYLPSELEKERKESDEYFSANIPVAWLKAAYALGPKAFAVGVFLHHKAKLERSNTYRLSNEWLGRYGIDRHTKYRAFRQLEGAALISTTNLPGRATGVTINEVSTP